MSSQAVVRDSAIDLIRSMPDNAGWEDIMYEIYVKQKIEKGMADSENKKVMSHENVKKMFLRK